MTKPRRSPRNRADERARRKADELARLQPHGAGPGRKRGTAKPLPVLATLFALGSKRRIVTALERERATTSIAAAIESPVGRLKPHHFGVGDWRGLAALIAQHFENIKSLSAASLREFTSAPTRRGHEAALRGFLFNRFVRHYGALWSDLEAAAAASIKELNATLPPRASGAPSGVPQPTWNSPTKVTPRLVTAAGKPVADCGRFNTKAQRGAEVVMLLRKSGTTGDDGRTRVMATDDVLFTTAPRAGGGEYTLLAAEVESKTSGAAGGFGKQLGDAQGRYGSVELVGIEIDVGTKTPRYVPADQLVFDLHDSTKYAISAFGADAWRELVRTRSSTRTSALLKKDSTLRVQSTSKGGYTRGGAAIDFHFMRLDLAVESAEFSRIARAAMTAGAK